MVGTFSTAAVAAAKLATIRHKLFIAFRITIRRAFNIKKLSL
jgi:hypothetical protein